MIALIIARIEFCDTIFDSWKNLQFIDFNHSNSWILSFKEAFLVKAFLFMWFTFEIPYCTQFLKNALPYICRAYHKFNKKIKSFSTNSFE